MTPNKFNYTFTTIYSNKDFDLYKLIFAAHNRETQNQDLRYLEKYPEEYPVVIF